jgi:hypothetical protein
VTRVIRRKTNRRHMIGDHYGPTAGRATVLVRAVDEILGTHRSWAPRSTRSSPGSSSRPGTCSWTWRMPGHERNSSCMTGTQLHAGVRCRVRGGRDPGHPLRRSGTANEFDHGVVDWQLPT